MWSSFFASATKERDGDWFIDWAFGAGGHRVVKAVGHGLATWLMPSLEYVLQRGLALHVVEQVAAFEEAKLAYEKEEEADRGRGSAARDMLATARRKLVDGLRDLRQCFVEPLLDKAMRFIEAQVDCVPWAGVCSSAEYKHFKQQLETMRGWEAPTFSSEAGPGKAMLGLEELLSFVPMDFSSSDAILTSAGSTIKYCLHLYRYAYLILRLEHLQV